MGALYPARVQRIAALCSSAKTSPHNLVFLEGLQAALTTDPAWNGERFVAFPERGLRAFARVCRLGFVASVLSRASLFEDRLRVLEGFFDPRIGKPAFSAGDAANLLSRDRHLETFRYQRQRRLPRGTRAGRRDHRGQNVDYALADICTLPPTIAGLRRKKYTGRARFQPISVPGGDIGRAILWKKVAADEAFIKTAVRALLNDSCPSSSDALCGRWPHDALAQHGPQP